MAASTRRRVYWRRRRDPVCTNADAREESPARPRSPGGSRPQGQRRAGENGVTCGSSGSLIFVSMNDMSQHEWGRGIKRFDAEARPGDVVYVQVPAMHTVFAPRLIGEICTFKTIEAFKERLENRLAGLAALRRRGLSVVVALASPAVRKSNFNGIHVMVAALIRPSSPRY